MNFLKKYLKLFIGAGAIILVLIIFVFSQKANDLENDNLKSWIKAPIERRATAARLLIASDESLDLIVACVDKMASLPDSGEMAIRDAVTLCNVGVQLKSNI